MSKVLIIDDDAVLREFLEASLADVGHDVQAVGSEAVKSREGFDAVLDEIERPFSLTKFEHRLRLMGLTETL
jgi:CheY-like chemotaxis protein